MRGGAKTKKAARISRRAACIRGAAATARLTRKQFVNAPSFSTATMDPSLQSGKFTTLIQTIRDLDKKDMADHGTKFKHFVFTDIRESAHGIKALISYMIAGGFEFRMKPVSKTILRGGRSVETKKGELAFVARSPVATGCDGFACLQSNPLWKNPVSVKLKKEILSTYNARPDNVHGELLRIVLLDSKYKEGIDLFDVKYVHILEPAIASADLKQAVGRATRFCGQRGLHFVPKHGWPLHVYIYTTEVPGRAPFVANDAAESPALQKIDAHTLMLQHSGIDLALLNLSNVLTRLAIASAVDYDLNYAINNFELEKDIQEETDLPDRLFAEVVTQDGGAAAKTVVAVRTIDEITPDYLAKCAGRKSTLFPFTRAKLFRVGRALGLAPTRRAKRAWYCEKLKTNQAFLDALLTDTADDTDLASNTASVAEEPSMFPEPRTIGTVSEVALTSRALAAAHALPFAAFQRKILDLFGAYAWKAPAIKSGCDAVASTGAVGRPVAFTQTQNFIRNYLRPDVAVPKGMLAWHSVGTGKTCMAIAAATTAFEAAGYTILWVTRNSLMSDMYKNIFGAVCSIPIQEALAAGKTLPTNPAAQKRMLSRAILPPISYRTFQNALEGKNVLGRALRHANPTDPLRKTFLIIDEVHKLLDGDLSPSESADFTVLQRFIHSSYARSGADSVRPLLMTATPISNSPQNLLDILNVLIEDPARRFPALDAFRAAFTQADGSFTDKGRADFQERVKGRISYLNREFDPTTFAQPVFHNIVVPVGDRPAYTMDALLQSCDPHMDPPTPDPACEELESAIAAAKSDLKAAEAAPAKTAADRATRKARVSDARKTLRAHMADKRKRCKLPTPKTHFTSNVWPAAKQCYAEKKRTTQRKGKDLKSQMDALEACFKEKGGTRRKGVARIPALRDFKTALQSRYASYAVAANDDDKHSVAPTIGRGDEEGENF